ncbi:unnamed protein product [Aphanomyces euteiches]|uniref:Mitochondrial import inner membrane translocase subunit n=1 Tax=Aphanomyces euteiches TaxID=100861 RepID=A0A6G0XBS8_9STRA|nr:hypothetical protein Ae201684_006580 [Aphanomyces euteiches]KAG9413597.1 hypothetical protein AC1031_012824 [Aphanomyces cochlioides]KAH9088245.1 hypothetical protein LEN26_019595 [Aphanomyces euteiches]KAH9090833.1 hypothetical protein Ae201684P_006237 [Aphanomyces euteiches]KAH9114738.1 hypothetical protein AeMF1_011200 [Aphanomyces euteiches]
MFPRFASAPVVEPTDEEKKIMEDVKKEADLLMHMQDKMRSICFNKCVHRFREGDLDMGESSCDDRCVAKYLQAYYRLNQFLPRLRETIVKEAPLTKPEDLIQ